MTDNNFNENINLNSEPTQSVNSNEGGSFDLNSFSTISGKSDIVYGKSEKQTKANDKTPKAKKRNIAKTMLTLFLVCVITFSFLMGAFAIYVFGFVDDTIQEDLDNLVLNFTTTVYVEDGDSGEYVEYKRIHGSENRIWVGFAEMPQYLKDAFTSIEDQRFETHGGVDWKRTISAFANMFLNFSDSEFGGSTITQQLVKNLTMDSDKSAMRKIREIMRARRIEAEYHKDTILECYLNTINMGGGKYGVEVASNYYFGKSVGDLTIAESAVLASIVKSPEYYRPDKNFDNNAARKELVLDKMLELKKITKDEYDAAMDEKVNIVADPSVSANQEIYSYFIDALIEEVANDLVKQYNMDKSYAVNNVYNGGYKIYCTLDADVQAAVESVFYNDANRIKGPNDQLGQSAITVMDYRGNVVGIAGGLGEKKENRGLNRATSSPRQPGSTMKPIASYALALENDRITYSTMLNDKKVMYNNNTWTPKNWYGGYWGNITAAYAVQRSVNTIPVMLVNELTPQVSYDFLTKKLGITTLNYPDDANLAPMGLGGTNGGITTLESAAAYAVFGNGGYYFEPSFYTKVTDQHDNVVLEKKSKPIAAISEDTATIMNHMLQNVVYGSNGTGVRAAAYVPSQKIYAKTGTSSETNDLWFVGGTPYYVASCWYGFDNNGEISQSGIALKLWGQVMSKVHSGLKSANFEESKYVVKRYYCTSTGLLATNACESTAVGWYKKNDRTTCNKHAGTIRDIVVSSSETSTSSSSSDVSETEGETTSSNVITSSQTTTSVAE